MPSPVHLYHIAYSAETSQPNEDGYLILDNTANERPDWREYWPMRKFLLTSSLDEQAYYGFFSPKFAHKTGLSYAQVMAFIGAHGPETDAFLFSPQADVGALFINVFEGGDAADPGFLNVCQELFGSIGIAVDLRTLVMDSRTVVHSNFIIARPKFWRQWLELNDKIFSIAESAEPSELQTQLLFATTYPGAVQRKVFIVERTASLLLTLYPWKTAAANPFTMGWSVQLIHHWKEAILADALKIAMREQAYPEYFAAYSRLREEVFPSKH
jgi:hypothetical protein